MCGAKISWLVNSVREALAEHDGELVGRLLPDSLRHPQCERAIIIGNPRDIHVVVNLQ